MKKIIVISLMLVLIVSLSLLVYASNSWSKDQKVDAVRVIGNDILASNEVIQLTDSLCYKSNLTKDELFQIDSLIKLNQYIKDTDVYSNGNKLIIEIEERKPVAYYIKNGKVSLISDDLVVLNMRNNLKDYNLPVLRLENGKIKDSQESLTTIFNQIRENSDLALLLSEIILYNSTGEIDLVLNQHSILVKLGRDKSIEDKFKKFNEFWYKVALKKGIDFKIIDLRWDKKVLVS